MGGSIPGPNDYPQACRVLEALFDLAFSSPHAAWDLSHHCLPGHFSIKRSMISGVLRRTPSHVVLDHSSVCSSPLSVSIPLLRILWNDVPRLELTQQTMGESQKLRTHDTHKVPLGIESGLLVLYSFIVQQLFCHHTICRTAMMLQWKPCWKDTRQMASWSSCTLLQRRCFAMQSSSKCMVGVWMWNASSDWKCSGHIVGTYLISESLLAEMGRWKVFAQWLQAS